MAVRTQDTRSFLLLATNLSVFNRKGKVEGIRQSVHSDRGISPRGAASMYAYAVLAAALALLCRWMLDPTLQHFNAFVTLYAAVAIIAIEGGWAPAAATAVAGGLGAWYWFIPVRHSFALGDFSYSGGMWTYLFVCALIGAAGEVNRQSKKRLADANAALRNSEREFQVFANAIPELCWMAASDGQRFWHNDRWYEYTGTSPNEMRGSGWQRVHDPKILPVLLERWANAIRAKQPFEMELPLRGADHKLRWFLMRVRPEKDGDDNVTGWFGVNTDIHELRNVREELQRSQERLALAQDAGQSGMFDWDIQGNRVTWNRELEAVFGLPAGGFGGKFSDWETRVYPDDLTAAKRSIEQALAGKQQQWRLTYRVSRADTGAVRWVDARARIDYEGDQPVRMIGIHVDVTDRLEAESLLRESEQKYRNVLLRQRDDLEERVAARTEELDTLNAQLREMSGLLLQARDDERRRISHELHEGVAQRLAAMALNLGFLRNADSEPDKQRAELVSQSAALLDDVLREIRNISYLLHPPLLDEVGLVSALPWFADGFEKRTGIALKVEFRPPDFGRLDEDSEIALYRVVQEVLTNVSEHSESARATLVLEKRDDHVALTIQDFGKGIAADRLQQPSLSAHTPGIGIMGLRERLRQLCGELAVYSGSGGTRVEATLPYQPRPPDFAEGKTDKR